MESDTILSIDPQNYYLDYVTRIWAFFTCILATVLFSCLAALTQWGHDLGFDAAELLLYRSSVQLLFAIISAFLYHMLTNCWCFMNDEENTTENVPVTTDDNITHLQKAYGVSINKLSVSHSSDSDKSLTSYSNSAYNARQTPSGYTPRQTYGIFAIRQIFSSINTQSSILTEIDEFEAQTQKSGKNVLPTATKNESKCWNYSFYEWTLLFMRGLFGALNNAAIIYAICLLDLGDAISLTCLSPLLVLIFIFFFLNEADFVINNKLVTARFFISVIVSIAGIVLIIQPEFIGRFDNHNGADDMNGWVWGCTGSVLSAAIYVTLKKGCDENNININHYFYSHCVLSSILGIILSYSNVYTLYGNIDPTKHEYHVLLLILIGFVSFCAQFLYSISLQFITPKDAIFCTEILLIIFGYIWQIFVFKQSLGYITLIGAGCIAICIILIYCDIHYKMLNIIKVREAQVNKTKLITNDIDKTKTKTKKGLKGLLRIPILLRSDSSEALLSGDTIDNASLISSALTFNMDF